MHTIDLRDRQPTRAELALLVPRAVTDVAVATAVAQELIDDVRARGEIALHGWFVDIHAGEVLALDGESGTGTPFGPGH